LELRFKIISICRKYINYIKILNIYSKKN